MKQREASPAQIRDRGIEALANVLGPVGMVRFLQQFDTGRGDYARERGQWLKDITVPDAVEEIKRQRGEPG
jgi:hypothetical protein